MLRTHIYSSIGSSLLDLIFRLLADEEAWPCGQASYFDKPIPRVYDRSKEQQFKEHYSSEELKLLKKTNEDFYKKTEVLYFQENIFVLKKLEKNVLK